MASISLACILVILFRDKAAAKKVPDRHVMNPHRKKYLRRLAVMDEHVRMHTTHEVVVAVAQNNLDKLERELEERSNPYHTNYQQWLSFDEIGEMTRNVEATAKIKSWLTASNATITEESPYGEYITARASVSTWERLLQTDFHVWEEAATLTATSTSANAGTTGTRQYVRAESYSIPHHLTSWVSAVFNVVNVPGLTTSSTTRYRRSRPSTRCRYAEAP